MLLNFVKKISYKKALELYSRRLPTTRRTKYSVRSRRKYSAEMQKQMYAVKRFMSL